MTPRDTDAWLEKFLGRPMTDEERRDPAVLMAAVKARHAQRRRRAELRHRLRLLLILFAGFAFFLLWPALLVFAASPDLNGDGQVDGLDLGILHGAWGEATPGNGVADLDGDGDIDGRDLGVLLGAWGPVTIAVRSDWGVAGTVYHIPAADHDAEPSPVGPGWTRYAWGWTTTPTGRRERAFAVHMRGETP